MSIAVTCSCGKRLRVGDDHAGRKIRCPGCDKVLRVPDEAEEDDRDEPDDRVRAGRPAAKKAARPSRDDDEGDSGEVDVRARRRARKKPKRSPLPLILGGAALVMLLGGGGFAGYWIFLRGEQMTESAFLAPDAQGFVSVRLADVAQLDGFQKAIQAGGQGNQLNDEAAKLGLAVSDIERVTYVVQDIDQQIGWGVVSTTKPYDKKAVLAKLQNATSGKHEGKTYHVGTLPGGGLAKPPVPMMPPGGKAAGPASTQQVLFFAGPRLLVMAESEASMKRGLTAAMRSSPAGPLADAVKQVGGPKHVYFAFHLPPAAQEKLKSGVAMLGAQAKPAAPLLQFTAVSGSMEFGTDVVVDLALKYADDGRAKAAMTSFTALKGLAELFVLPMVTDPKAAEALKATFAGLTAEQRGADLGVKLQVASRLLEAAVPQMAGGPGK